MEAISPGSKPTPARSLTVFAWIGLIFGASTPLRLALEWRDLLPVLKLSGLLERYGFSFVVDVDFKLGIGLLGGIGGWGLLKRKAWAPLAACIAGGVILVESLNWMVEMAAPTLLIIARSFSLKWVRLIAAMGLPLLIHATLLTTWYFLLRIVMREKGRREFPKAQPELTPGMMWGALVLSGTLCGLFLLLQRLLWEVTPSIS